MNKNQTNTILQIVSNIERLEIDRIPDTFLKTKILHL